MYVIYFVNLFSAIFTSALQTAKHIADLPVYAGQSSLRQSTASGTHTRNPPDPMGMGRVWTKLERSGSVSGWTFLNMV